MPEKCITLDETCLNRLIHTLQCEDSPRLSMSLNRDVYEFFKYTLNKFNITSEQKLNYLLQTIRTIKPEFYDTVKRVTHLEVMLLFTTGMALTIAMVNDLPMVKELSDVMRIPVQQINDYELQMMLKYSDKLA